MNTNEAVAIKKMSYSGKQSLEVNCILLSGVSLLWTKP